jgi:divalent metal cation (Fe/Co/Zn/Cd) transporter
MKTFGVAVVAAVAGYFFGMLSGMFLIEAFSSNRHDQSVEAAMTGAFVVGPLMAVSAVIMVLVVRARRSH